MKKSNQETRKEYRAQNERKMQCIEEGTQEEREVKK
jgi:hypothetical protein